MSRLAKNLAEVEELQEDDFEQSRQPKKARYQGRPIDEPAGHKRKAALSRVRDEQEEDLDGKEVAARALKDIKIDGEIVSNFNSGHVSNANPAFEYKWARYVKPFGGVAPVDYDLTLTLRTTSHGVLRVWEKVNGAMVEAMEHREVDGTRKVGDTMLIRCRKDIYALLRRWEEEKVQARTQSPANALQTLGDRTGIPVRVQDIAVSKRGYEDPAMQRALKHAAANEIANRQLDQKIREGRVDGLEIGD